MRSYSACKRLGIASLPVMNESASAREQDLELPRFVIFGSGRSGSRLLVELLNSHPLIFCENGMFIDDPGQGPRDWLADRITLAKQMGAGAYGIRLLVPQLVDIAIMPDIRSFLTDLAADGWHIIHLFRLSPVRVVVSYVHAARNGFHVMAEDGAWQFEPMTADAEEVAHWICMVSDWMTRERAALQGVPTRELAYEPDLATERRQQVTVSRISALLGLPEITPRTSLRRQIPDRDLAELITNYDEIRPLLDAFIQNFPDTKLRSAHSNQNHFPNGRGLITDGG